MVASTAAAIAHDGITLIQKSLWYTLCAGTVAGASSKVGDPEGQPNLATGECRGDRSKSNLAAG
eukprot:scaffold52731_cov19-Tisochrysis_lutea.AAC.2